jgi:hypothetical protein
MKRVILLLASAALVASLAAGEGARCLKPLETCLAEKRAMLEKRGVLGFLWSRVTPDEPAPPGAQYVVRSVPRGYPASAAGLKEHDVLLTLNGKDLAAMPRHQLESELQRVSVGERVSLRVWREGRTLTLTLRAAKPAAESIEAWLGNTSRTSTRRATFPSTCAAAGRLPDNPLTARTAAPASIRAS